MQSHLMKYKTRAVLRTRPIWGIKLWLPSLLASLKHPTYIVWQNKFLVPILRIYCVLMLTIVMQHLLVFAIRGLLCVKSRVRERERKRVSLGEIQYNGCLVLPVLSTFNHNSLCLACFSCPLADVSRESYAMQSILLFFILIYICAFLRPCQTLFTFSQKSRRFAPL